jgi:hypothetical protein
MARLVPVRSPLLGEYLIDVLSSGYLDVSVPRVCFYNPMYSSYKYLVYPIIMPHQIKPSFRADPGAELKSSGINNKVSGGLPHSEIYGSKLILSSP